MKNLTTALLFFCAFNLTNATASTTDGVPASDLDVGAGGGGGAGRGAYFECD